MRKTIYFLLCTALLVLPGPARATAWDVYLLVGQSNMDGRGKAAELSDEQRAPLEGAQIFYRNPPTSSETWKPLAPGYSVAPGYKGTLPSLTFGPEIGFVRSMMKVRPGDHLALIKGSKGGSSLSKDWNPGLKGQPETQGLCYRNFLETVELAKKTLAAGDTYDLRGVLWHQGESDAGSSAELYQQLLTTFIARLREDLGQPTLPFVIGEVFDNGKRDSVRSAQRSVAQTVPHTAFASAADLKTSDAGTHFDAASQIILGERFAGEMLPLLNETTPKP